MTLLNNTAKSSFTEEELLNMAKLIVKHADDALASEGGAAVHE